MDAPPIVVPPLFPQEPPKPLEKLTYPPYVLVLAAVTLVAFLFALTRVPRAIRAGVDAEHGRRDLAAGKYELAEAELGRTIKVFPEATDERIDYAQACLKNGDFEEVGKTLQWFEGKEVTKEQSERLDAISNEGVEAMKELEKLVGKPKAGGKP